MYPFKSLSDGGARLPFGSDWPAASYYSTFRPLEAIEIAVTRQELGKLADLVVLDKDLTAIPPPGIHPAEVKLTMMNGVVRHEN